MSGVYHAFVASQSRLYVSAENAKPQEATPAPVHAHHLIQRETVYTPLGNYHSYKGMRLSELLSQPPPPPPPSPADPPAVAGSSSLSTGNIFDMRYQHGTQSLVDLTITSHAMEIDDSDDEESDKLIIDEFSEEDDDEHRVDDVLLQEPPDEPEVQETQQQGQLASRSSTNMPSSRGIARSLRHRNQGTNRARLLKNCIFKKRSRKTHCCRKCRVHGDEKPYKGHGNCPFKNCTCDGCRRIDEEREKSRANRRVLSRMEMLRKKYKTMADWYSRAK